MAELRKPRHGLESFLSRSLSSSADALEITIEASRAYINLRGQPDDVAFVEQTEAMLGQAIPVAPNTMTRGDCRIFWLGPDEWLVSTAIENASATRTRLVSALQDLHVAVNDQSGGLIGLTLGGACAELVLAKGCTLDLHVSQFPAGHCAQSGLAKANVLLARDSAGQFEIIVRRSFANYLLAWFEQTAKEFGIRISAS